MDRASKIVVYFFNNAYGLNLFFLFHTFEYTLALLANLSVKKLPSLPPYTIIPLQRGPSIFKSLLCFCLLGICAFSLTAQDSVLAAKQNTNGILSGVIADKIPITNINGLTSNRLLTPKQINSRVRFVAISNVAGYSVILAGLNKIWYANYPRSGFHFFNDNNEWLQVDKVGHMYSAYIEGRTSMELWRWTGIERKKRIWIGGLSGTFYQTIIEILDGFSSEWGFSLGDFSANVLGSGALIAQELTWNDQRIKLKFSFHKNNYGTAQLDQRANEIYGKSLAERSIKDYNAQTYWASVNLKSFFPKTNLPAWMNIAAGYGADGMFGATENVGKDKQGNITFERSDIKRYRRWYLSPDIDFTKIKTNKKGLRLLFMALSAFKFPAPGLEFSNGKFKVNALHF